MAEARKLPGVRASKSCMPGEPWVAAVRVAPSKRSSADRITRACRDGRRKSSQLARQNPGLENVDTSYKERKPQLRVAIDRDRAADLGVSLQTVGRTLETVLGSRIVTRYVDRGREYDVILQARDDARQTVTDLTNIQVRSDRTRRADSVVERRENRRDRRVQCACRRFNRLRAIEIQAGSRTATRWVRPSSGSRTLSRASCRRARRSCGMARAASTLAPANNSTSRSCSRSPSCSSCSPRSSKASCIR